MNARTYDPGAPQGIRFIGRALYEVTSFRNSGQSYTVDLADGSCTCPDRTHRGGECKHLRLSRIEAERLATETARTLPTDRLRRHVWRGDLRREVRRGIATALFQTVHDASRAAQEGCR